MIDRITEVNKYNDKHDALGRFASKGGGGGGGLSGSDVRDFGVPGHSGYYKMNAKEKKLANTIIETEELELTIKDSSDALGNSVTSIHGTREDYQIFKEVWEMVAPATLKKGHDTIEEVNKNKESEVPHMNESMKKLKAQAATTMSTEKTYDSKAEALKEAIKQREEMVSVWKPPGEEKYVIVQFENREDAQLCDYTEVYDTGKLYDMAKENIDHIEEV